MSLLRREHRQWIPEPVIPPFPGTNPFGSVTGGTPTTSQSLQVSAVWACVRLVADVMSMMPLCEYTMKNGQRVQLPSSPLVGKPSSDANMPDWIYMHLVSLMLRGNVYGRVTMFDRLRYPTKIELQHPDNVQVRQRLDGQIEYRFGGKLIDAADVYHTRAYRMPGSRMGLSPVQYAARAINTDAAIGEFAYGFFRDGAHPSSILLSDRNLNQQQARTFKDRFTSSVQGREPAVLSGGVKYQQVQVSPDESQFLETQKLGVAAIARIYGVPPEMIAAESGNSMTYANVEQRSIDFLVYSIQPWITRLEAAISQLLPGGRHVRFDTNVLLRTDLETRLRAYGIGIASKQTTPDEARAASDLPPLTAAQKALLELVPLDISPTGRPVKASGTAPTEEEPQQ